MLTQGLLWAAYPFIIFFGLRVGEPRSVAIALAIVLVLRRRSDARRLLGGLSPADWGVLLALLLLAGATALTNSETLLRLYPVAVSAGMLLVFGLSLRHPPSMIERFARIFEPALPPAGVRYTRRVTQIWCIFFVANGSVAAWTALFASRELWALYNGLIAYLLMGALLSGEWLVRRALRSRGRLA